MNQESNKILVTGGLGYIGSHTVVELVENGFTPIIVDNLSNSYKDVLSWLTEIVGFEPEFHQLDCCNKSSFIKVFEKHPDLYGVIHFAAYKAVGESVENPLKYYQNNLDSLNVLLDLMNEFKIKNLVFSSSCTVYGIPEGQIQVNENTPLQKPNSPYGHTKLMSEQIIQDVTAATSIKASLLRYFNPVGAHKSAKIGELPIGKPNNLVPFITQTAAGLREKLSIFGNDYDTIDGTCIRDYIHVSDLANAHVKAIQFLQNQTEKTSVFNLGTANGNTVKQVVDAFEKSTGIKLNYEYVNRRAGDVPAIYADASKANHQLQWSCKYSLADSMITAWNWQKNLKKIGFNIQL